MSQSIISYFEKEQQTFLETCTACGHCINCCPIIPHTDISETPAYEIQEAVLAFLRDGTKNSTVYTRAFSCMECFRCAQDVCPNELNPMQINEIIKWHYRQTQDEPPLLTKPSAQYSSQRILASLQVSQAEYDRLFTESQRTTARYVFFPGCNVYAQPEKILEALDMVELLSDGDYAFVPGLDYCCSDTYLFDGEATVGEQAFRTVIDKFASYQPELVILWCPTCQCRFSTIVSDVMGEIPFRFQSLAQFLAERLNELVLLDLPPQRVTLHEACKQAYTKVDLHGPREVLRQLPGLSLVEMERHGEQTACCGSGAVAFFQESFAKVRDERMEEAAQTGADVLVDVCHFCHEAFVSQQHRYPYDAKSYITLVAQSIGIVREDRFKKYMQWGDLKRILEDARFSVAWSLYPREQIVDVVKKTFCGGNELPNGG